MNSDLDHDLTVGLDKALDEALDDALNETLDDAPDEDIDEDIGGALDEPATMENLCNFSILKDGGIGSLIRVTLGSFGENDNFESAFTWLYNGKDSTSFSYIGDSQPAKFRISLKEELEEGRQSWEWMDLLEPNILGVVFDAVRKRPTVYFVIDKAPQFYRQSLPGKEPRQIPSRISYPSSTKKDEDEIPREVQFSRVIRVEYQRHQYFDLARYKARLSPEQRETMYLLKVPARSSDKRASVKWSDRLPNEIDDIVQANFNAIGLISYNLGFCGCQLGLVKLLLNGNLSVASTKTTEIIVNMRERCEKTERDGHRLFGEKLDSFARKIGTSHVRSLQRLYAKAHRSSLPKHLKISFIEFEDLLKVFDVSVRTSNDHVASPGVFEALIHPSHVEVHGPIDAPINSVFEKYSGHIASFLRIKFVDNHSVTLKPEAGASVKDLVSELVVPVLEGRIQILSAIGERYEFLGYTLSSLKRRKAVWFFRSSQEECKGCTSSENQNDQAHEPPRDASIIRNCIGDWSHLTIMNGKLATHPSKWGARTSQAFTGSYRVATLSPKQWTRRMDVGNPKYPNTDGCGLISQELCDDINAKLAPHGFSVSNCSTLNITYSTMTAHDMASICVTRLIQRVQKARAFQIRFGGCKGVVYTGVASLFEGEYAGCRLLLRESQQKFITPNPDESQVILRVASTAGDCHQSLFMTSALKAFEDSKADVKQIRQIFRDTYNAIRDMSSPGLCHLQQIYRVSAEASTIATPPTAFLSLAARLLQSKIHPSNYRSSFLRSYLVELAKRSHSNDMFKIPIPGSYCLLGLTDDYGMLERPDHVYVRADGKTITGWVLIYRDPVLHIGDIQWAEAINDDTAKKRMEELGHKDIDDRIKSLHNMGNVIFFSQQWNEGIPPLPNQLSGGDLDGDRFEVLTNECGFWKKDTYKVSPDPRHDDNEIPSSMTRRTVVGDFNITDLARFIGDYVENDCFEDLQDVLMCIADRAKSGMHDENVQSLARWLSKAVDYPKSGEGVNIVQDVLQNPAYKVDEKPSFLRPSVGKGPLDLNEQYYESHKLLGRLHHSFGRIKFKAASPQENSHADLRAMVKREWGMAEGPSLEVQAMEEHVTKTVGKEAFRYRQYVLSQYLHKGSEVHLFLREQQNDFVQSFLNRLVEEMLAAMEKRNLVAFKRGQATIPQARLRPCRKLEDVEHIYRQLLARAW